MENRECIKIISFILLSGVITSCGLDTVQVAEGQSEQMVTHSNTMVQSVPTKDINNIGINEDKSIYEADDPTSLAYFYVTVRKGAQGSETDHSFSEVNNVVKFADDMHVDREVLAEALVQVGDETGPLYDKLGYGQEQSNATIEVRGNSTSVATQKSYNLKLNKGEGLWRGQTNIALNKHTYDLTRIRNKLYFDLLKEIEEVPSLRTQFVRLFIKDETAGSEEFVDYGFFTQVEKPTTRYLSNHGLDANGYLYKAKSFNFEMNEAIKNYDDSNFNEVEFESILSCKGKKDNKKLMDMIEAINDTSRSIDEIIDTYFDRENYITWLSYNILMGNIDTTMQNFYLYSPLNGDKWYFLPWDGDGCLSNYENGLEGNASKQGKWEVGISNYWGVILHQRFLKIDSNRESLSQKIEALKTQITREKVDQLIQGYNEVAKPYVSQMPDLLYLGNTLEVRQLVVSRLSQELDENYQVFKESLQAVMPFYIYEPEKSGNKIIFSWEEAYDLQNQMIRYTFQLSKMPDMSQIIYEIDTGYTLQLEIEDLKPGKYYCKVVATAEDGRVVSAMNKSRAEDVYYPDIMELIINE